ncbi:macrophage mannose receptor 1-like [Clupea harengus]|uniref:Macrophage mannose receptor 1-like n=1 Tax=Clupea harengus TaxID=7950 RepID=A0A6P8H1E4_CLUHA|nr:macrophage mannose receptor 1-like [Clupea harengus]
MDRNIIQTLFLNSLCVALMAGSRQYHYVANQKTWYEAQAYCRERYTDLATISDSEELNSFKRFCLTQNISGSVWIGLYNDRHDWKWSAGSSDYRNWQSTTSETDPSNMAAEEYAVTYTGHWGNHWSCLAHNFICYDERQITSHGFVLISQDKSWRDAQSYCREHHTDLATVKNAAENEQIREMVASGGVIVWIGLHRLGWQWSDGSNFSQIFTLRSISSGSRRLCVVLVRQSPDENQWEAQDCSRRIPFVCYSAHKRQIVRVQFQSANMDLNATAAQSDILDQIRRKLQEQGLPADAKLSWRKQPDGQIFHKKNEKKEKKGRKKKSKDEF